MHSLPQKVRVQLSLIILLYFLLHYAKFLTNLYLIRLCRRLIRITNMWSVFLDVYVLEDQGTLVASYTVVVVQS